VRCNKDKERIEAKGGHQKQKNKNKEKEEQDEQQNRASEIREEKS
jgi:hypothetical protein